MIEVRNLIKYYGTARAVDGVSFSIQPGEVVGLLGPNGAGKSTTLRVLTGYLPPTDGKVEMAGLDISEKPLEIRRRVGYLSESNPLYESLGVWECLDLVGRLRGVPIGSLESRIRAVVEMCSLAGVVSKDIGQLSKGYRQRLGLALAIIHDPEIIVLDEPTSALDPIQQKEVRELILALREKKTVLLSTHILPEAQRLCDRLLIIHKGKIVAQGTVAELQAQMAGEASFYARLKGSRETLLAGLRSLHQVTAVEFVDETEVGCPSFKIISGGDPREDIFNFAVRERSPLIELRREGASLDEVFHALTKETV